MAAITVAGRVVQPDGTARAFAPLRPRDDRQPVSPSARRAAATGPLLQRHDGPRLRPAAFSTDGRPGLLLQQREVSLFARLARSSRRETSPGDELRARSGASRRV